MKSVFELSSTFRLNYDDPLEVHLAVTEFSDLGERHPAVQGTAFRRDGDTEHLMFLVEAVGPDEARALAESLADEIVAAIDARFGAGTIEPGEFEVVEAMNAAETADDLMSALGLDPDDLWKIASAATDRPVVDYPRARKAPPKKLAATLARHGLEGKGFELVLGNMVLASEAAVPEGPWKARPGREVGLDRKSTLLTLEGVRYELDQEGSVDVARSLYADLAGTGWCPVILPEVWEWVGPVEGVRITRTHEKGRTSLGLVPLEDDLDLLHFHHTDGANQGLSTTDIVNRLREWREHSEFDVVEAGGAHVTLAFTRLPDDVEAFAEEVYDFCPDTVDQDYLGPDTDDVDEYEDFLEQQTVQDLTIFLGRERQLRLWWD
jgi:hypothetical protein